MRDKRSKKVGFIVRASMGASYFATAFIPLFTAFCLLFTSLFLAPLALAQPEEPPSSQPQENPSGDPGSTDDSRQSIELLSQQQRATEIMNQIEELQKKFELSVEDYNRAKEDLSVTEHRLTTLNKKLKQRTKSFRKQQGTYEKRLTTIYKNGKVNFIDVLLNTESFTDFLNRFYLLTVVGQRDADSVRLLRLEKRQLELLKNQLEVQREKQATLELELKSKQVEIEDQLRLLGDTLGGVETEIREIIEQENNLLASKELERFEQLRIRALAGEPGLEALVDPTSVVYTALQYLGVPYLWGGEDPEKGLDCSGFSMLVFRQHGVLLPHYSRYQFKMGTPVDRKDLKAGDLVFFGDPIHHLGIYIGSDLFIHAPQTGDVIKISKFSDRKDFAGAKRYPLQSKE